MTTSTAVRYFIAVSAEEANRAAIYGIGHTAQEAIDDAVSGAQLASNDIPEDEQRRRDQYGDLISVHYVAQECTRALHEFVEKNGGAGLSWGENDDRLQDLEVDGYLADEIAEFVNDGVEKNWLYNEGHPSSWTAAQSAIDIYINDDADADADGKTYKWSQLMKSHQRLANAVAERVQKFMDEYPVAEAAE
ncbi:MAG TPA: hypothetical protein VGN60_05205 [Devosia sp.]|jgi:hypothetical protein|nr:hypothetical protein [Devosia sp.]